MLLGNNNECEGACGKAHPKPFNGRVWNTLAKAWVEKKQQEERAAKEAKKGKGGKKGKKGAGLELELLEQEMKGLELELEALL